MGKKLEEAKANDQQVNFEKLRMSSEVKVERGLGCVTAKFVGPTNFRGSRVIVRGVRMMQVSWDHAKDHDGNFEAAVQAYANRYKVGGTWVRASLPGNNGYVFVRTVAAKDEVES